LTDRSGTTPERDNSPQRWLIFLSCFNLYSFVDICQLYIDRCRMRCHYCCMQQKKITVYDISKEIGLSPSTVSRVLNNSTLVGEETRKRVLESAERLGYRKRKIRRHHNRAVLNIRLFLPVTPSPKHQLFYDTAELIRSIEEGFGGVRVNIIVSAGQYLLQHKKGGGIDGCIFAFCHPPDELLLEIERWGIPSIYIDREPETGNFIAVDNEAAMDDLLSRVVDAGSLKRVLYLGYLPVRDVSELRKQAIGKAVRKRGMDFNASNWMDLKSLDDLTEAELAELIKGGFSPIMCFNDMLAVYVYQLALKAGYSVPENFSLTGFGNSPVGELTLKKIDTVNLSVKEMGVEAGQWLKKRIIDKDEKPIRKKIAVTVIPGNTVSSRSAVKA
jgi:LacI family transcriptional regulator